MKLYNTLSKKVDVIRPLNDQRVSLFVCGPTVYDYSHLGHAKTYIQMDLLARVLRASGHNVFYLQNITDIDDKIIERANKNGIKWQDLTAEFEAAYKQDMEVLGNTSVTEYARATDYIPQIVAQVEVLIDKSHAYKTADGIYFEIATFKSYGKLSGRQEIKQNDAQTRIDESDQKRGWNDFCVWKFAKPGEPTWQAPFGDGRPGWHIEDTAITEHFFGPQYDVHGGAVDLVFPHHEAELTQMEAASGKVPFVGTWVHAGFLNINSDKMSKSTGNFYTIRDVLAKGYDPTAIRLFMLQSHYKSAINFSFELLDASTNRLHDIRAFADLRLQDCPQGVSPDFEGMQAKLLEALCSDLGTPEALSILSDAMSQSSGGIANNNIAEFKTFLAFLDQVFGLNLLKSSDISEDQKLLLRSRQTARTNKQWQESDKIRQELVEQGIGINDNASTQIWFRL